MSKEKKHEHEPFPSEVFVLKDYAFLIAVIRCSDSDCDWETWDYGESIKEA